MGENQLTLKKKIYFNITMLVFSLVFILIIELILRVFSYGNNMHLIVSHPNKNYKEYFSINPLIGEKYFSKFDATGATNDIFLKKKPENGFRIFVMGSSTLVGFPYEKNLMATRILQQRLQDAYPNKEIEIVNTAITAINSITLRDYIKEIVNYEPDAILFYAGHNEFYGAFGVGSNETMSQNIQVRNLHFFMMHSRLYQLMRASYTNISTVLSKNSDLANAKGSLMKRIVSDKDIVYGSDTYNKGIQQFTTNVSYILTQATKHEIPVFISNLVSNVKDLPPLGVTSSQGKLEAGDLYNKAWVKWNENDSIAALDLFYKAKDLDPVRFRASEQINVIIDSLSKAHNCFFVPAKNVFMEASDGGLIGNNLLTEHVHPNIAGQFLLAESFYKQIVESKLIDTEPSLNNLRDFHYYTRNWGYTELDSLIGEYRVKQLKSYWPFVSLSSNVTFRETYSSNSYIDSLAFSVLFSTNPNVEALHEELAKKYLDRGDLIRALKEFEALIQMNPYWYNYYNQAANCLLKLNDLKAAENYLNKSISYRETYFACLMLAEIKMVKHEFVEAITDYQRALELSNSSDEKNEVTKKLYYAYHFIGDTQKKDVMRLKLETENVAVEEPAKQMASTYSNYIPYNVEGLIKKANEKILENDKDSAFFYLKQSLFINDTPLANRLVGDLLYGNKDNALLYYYNKAYASYSKDPEFMKNYCIANYVNKDFTRATALLSELKAIDPNYSELPKLESLLMNK